MGIYKVIYILSAYPPAFVELDVPLFFLFRCVSHTLGYMIEYLEQVCQVVNSKIVGKI